MSIPPVTAVPVVTPPIAPTATDAAPGAGFGDTVASMLGEVSGAEIHADHLAADVATGGETSVHELMVATTKASLSVDLLVQVRNRALEAYQEIMRMQI